MADVTRMQWGASDWQFADLYMPDEPSEFDKGHGVPCVMLIHGGFWKEKFTSELMKPIAEDLQRLLNSNVGILKKKGFG